jgi:hypothetical protein
MRQNIVMVYIFYNYTSSSLLRYGVTKYDKEDYNKKDYNKKDYNI